MKIDLSPEEVTLITLMRQAAPYSLIKVEKRPTVEAPGGDYSRITIETSTLLKNLIVVDIPIKG